MIPSNMMARIDFDWTRHQVPTLELQLGSLNGPDKGKLGFKSSVSFST